MDSSGADRTHDWPDPRLAVARLDIWDGSLTVATTNATTTANVTNFV